MAQPEAHRLQDTVCGEVPVEKTTLAPPSTTLKVEEPSSVVALARVSEAMTLSGA